MSRTRLAEHTALKEQAATDAKEGSRILLPVKRSNMTPLRKENNQEGENSELEITNFLTRVSCVLMTNYYYLN